MMKLLMIVLIMQRLTELVIARRNEKWMKKQGGIEVGQAHYPYLVMLHVLFILSFTVEVVVLQRSIHPSWPFILVLFLLTQIGRGWVIYSLGRYWNTKIIVVPDVKLVKKGPYRFLKHPNYVIVAVEFIIIPLLYEAYITSVVFTLLNIWILSVRIPTEEQALQNLTEYGREFTKHNRFLPSFSKKV
ncbi:isoprenylcysteine carboxyl methyltransferase family protein [Robertmurraya sp. FSL W8-0741]|uniref:isoprenylcysteine carboxylmethyltransferase family protein n=1 Tax=Robertmurraya sp. FSL W8-0741 TaxID=2954629 RepID=UPI0014821603